MKNIVFALAICLLMASCEKYESGQINNGTISKRMLSGSETTLKNNLDQAAKILAEVIQDEAVMEEITMLYNEDRTFYNLKFDDLLNEAKSAGSSFKNLREKFLNACNSSESKANWQDLANYLAKNGCYIYCPYPSSFYPRGTNSFTVAAHPVDNDEEGPGYRFEGKKVKGVTVNETYADTYPVILIMPPDEKGVENIAKAVIDPSVAKGDPVNEVKVGKIRCANYCGGIFEGELELRVSRGYPEYNISTGAVSGKFSTVFPVNYPRSYAKAAIKEYTVHSYAGWYTVNLPWDTNWKPEKASQIILVYEYDSVKESTVSSSVGYKEDDLSSTVSVSVKVTYNGDFLGISEWDRDWFYATNTNSGTTDEVKDGWVVRKTCDYLKLTTPARTIY
jgi:hypothetical protein